MQLSMFVQRTIENNKKAEIRPNKTYQSFVVASGSHRELKSFDRNWNDFLMKGLENNKWLLELFKDCHLWISVDLDHYFWAGMRST
ncbi:hypothetical protein Ahy_A07g033054 [Arachis hypogaea]|uniref:Protein FAR1-RELATED SEQUENCE n=1 Tax=Arachis hypogaea TaxID=3818 RepID=A0A445C8C0_ARAHY|nr:hypothetical protein Ahy_A07g033054 [Arachis hypogaea]